MKRGLKGTYLSVEPFHLFRYLDEQAFRYNEHKGEDVTRFREVLKSAFGRRLTFADLTGETVAADDVTASRAKGEAEAESQNKVPPDTRGHAT